VPPATSAAIKGIDILREPMTSQQQYLVAVAFLKDNIRTRNAAALWSSQRIRFCRMGDAVLVRRGRREKSSEHPAGKLRTISYRGSSSSILRGPREAAGDCGPLSTPLRGSVLFSLSDAPRPISYCEPSAAAIWRASAISITHASWPQRRGSRHRRTRPFVQLL
jgi:hypothetical protein